MGRIEKDRKTLYFMINFYCKRNHRCEDDFCTNCDELFEYASERLDLCQFGVEKPSCKKCTVHCYKPEMRDRIKKVMTYSGPRVIFYRPHEYIRYLKSGKQDEPSI